MKESNRFIRFFKDSSYRWVIKEKIILWFLSRKVVIGIISIFLNMRFLAQTKNMSSWETYLKRKEYEYKNLSWNFDASVFTLLLILRARVPNRDDSQDFNQVKQELLASDIINNYENAEFKQWLESIDYSVKDITYLENFFDELMSRD